jgi:ribosomal protein S18 acetylase RimI-like enzyme
MTIPALSLAIRPAEPADALAIETVRVAAWRVAYAALLPASYLDGMAPEELASRRAQRLATPREHQATLIAVLDEAVVGFAAVGPSRETPDTVDGELYAIYVTPERQGIGAGRALHAAALDMLRAADFGAATLRVLEGNAAARGFYERQGWRLDAVVEPFEPAPGISAPELRYRREL